MVDSVKNFLFEYFWLPIIDQSVHYNVYNTTVYALLFAVTAIYLVYPAVKKIDLSFDKRFFIAITPFVFMGGVTRSLRDLNILDTILLETPIIYILMFLFTFSLLYLTNLLEQRHIINSYSALMSVIGFFILSLVILKLYFNAEIDIGVIQEFSILLGLSTLVLLISTRFLSNELLGYQFIIPIVAHFADAASTITALNAGAEEKHVLANLFIDVFGVYGMFLMKSLVIIPVTYYLVMEFDGEKKNYYLFLVALLGLALATRNMTSIVFSV